MKKKQQKQLLIVLLLCATGYYLLVYLPEEENKEKMGKEKQETSQKTPEELQVELERDAWDKGRIWELPAQSWADRIVKAKSTSLTGQYQKIAGLFPDGDRNDKDDNKAFE